MNSNNLPDPSWIKYADNKGVHYKKTEDEVRNRFKVKVIDYAGGIVTEHFDDVAEAIGFFKQCKGKFLEGTLKEVDLNGDTVDYIDFYVKDEEEEDDGQ